MAFCHFMNAGLMLGIPFFELFALTGGRDLKTLVASAYSLVGALASLLELEPAGKTFHYSFSCYRLDKVHTPIRNIIFPEWTRKI